MSVENCSETELVESSPYVKSSTAKGRRTKFKIQKNSDNVEETDSETRFPLLGRVPRFKSPLRPRFGSVRNSFRKLNCFKSEDEEAIPMMEVPRHKSIDIGVGLARRVSLFLFTRRTVCVHPYHPYTPEQTTRKLYFCLDNKDKLTTNINRH